MTSGGPFNSTNKIQERRETDSSSSSDTLDTPPKPLNTNDSSSESSSSSSPDSSPSNSDKPLPAKSKKVKIVTAEEVSSSSSDSDDDSSSEKPPPTKKSTPRYPSKTTKPKKKKDKKLSSKKPKKSFKIEKPWKNKKVYGSKKAKRILMGLIWLEVVLIVLTWVLYFVGAYVLSDIGEVINMAFDRSKYAISHVFGGIVWVVLYCIGIGINIYYRQDIMEYDTSAKVADVWKYVWLMLAHVFYFIIRFPIFALMVYYSTNEEHTKLENEGLISVAMWLDTIVICLGAILGVAGYFTYDGCCR